MDMIKIKFLIHQNFPFFFIIFTFFCLFFFLSKTIVFVNKYILFINSHIYNIYRFFSKNSLQFYEDLKNENINLLKYKLFFHNYFVSKT